MTDILKPLLYYVLMLSAFALMIFTIGCSTENPLCSDNYCVSGEIFLRSQLLEGEEFSEIDVVESQLLAAFANVTPQTPVETTPEPSEVSLADIIADAAAGNTTYVDQTVTITGYVVWKSDAGTSMVIYETNNFLASGAESAAFFISTKVADDPVELANYVVGVSYTFTVYIYGILPPNENRNRYAIGANLSE